MRSGPSSVTHPMTAPEPVTEPALPGVREPALPGVREPALPGVREPALPGVPEPAADLVFGAFSDHGPWVLDPEQLPWQWDIDRIRRGTRREVPRLLAPGRVPPLGRLSRTLVEIGGALAGWMLFEWRRPSSRAGISRRLRTAFERLGSSYVKLGQIVSGGEGLFPDELVAEFKLLRDQVPPEPFADVRAVVEIDLGGSLEELFEWFDETPIAAASIAQVHAARLRTGEEVVVKVQRPRVAAAVPRRHRRPVVAGAPAHRAHPGDRAGQPAGAGRAVRRDRHRGARLPARGAEHARHRRACWPRPSSGGSSCPAPTPP